VGLSDDDTFELREREDGATVVLELAGELDLSTVGEVQERLERLREERRQVVLDLDALDFLDSTGIRLLLSACEDAQRDGWDFRVTRGSESVQRVLRAAQVIDYLPYAGADDT
jgi:anti-sigma B factor antagonist